MPPPIDINTNIINGIRIIRSTHHSVLRASPGQAIFGRDMLFDIPLLCDWYEVSSGQAPSAAGGSFQYTTIYVKTSVEFPTTILSVRKP